MLEVIVSILIGSIVPIYQNNEKVELDRTEYIVSDTAQYEHFWLRVRTMDDTSAVIENVHPSCGCILTTLQQALITKDKPGLIYVAITSSKIDSLQPVVIDVTTNRNRNHPLRCVISRKHDY